MQSILIEPEHLEKLSFVRRPNGTGVYSRWNLHIGYNGGQKEEANGGVTFVLPSAYIYLTNAPLPQDKSWLSWEMLDSSTVDVPNIHMLQNYLSHEGIELDFSSIQQ